MKIDCPSPLTPEHCAILNKLLHYCAETRLMLEKMASTGIPVEELQAHNEAHAAFATKNKATWFPDQP